MAPEMRSCDKLDTSLQLSLLCTTPVMVMLIFSHLIFLELATAAPPLSNSTSFVASAWIDPSMILTPSDASPRTCHSCSVPNLLRERIIPGDYARNYLQTLAFGNSSTAANDLDEALDLAVFKKAIFSILKKLSVSPSMMFNLRPYTVAFIITGTFLFASAVNAIPTEVLDFILDALQIQGYRLFNNAICYLHHISPTRRSLLQPALWFLLAVIAMSRISFYKLWSAAFLSRKMVVRTSTIVTLLYLHFLMVDTDFFASFGTSWNRHCVNQLCQWVEKAIFVQPRLDSSQSAFRDALHEASFEPCSGRRYSSADFLSNASASNINVVVHANIVRYSERIALKHMTIFAADDLSIFSASRSYTNNVGLHMDLLTISDDSCQRVIVSNLEDGSLHRFRAVLTILATGGYGGAYLSATSTHTCTGDDNAAMDVETFYEEILADIMETKELMVVDAKADFTATSASWIQDADDTHRGNDIQDVQNETGCIANEINQNYGEPGYQPFVFVTDPVSTQEKASYYAISECCVVNAVRDGPKQSVIIVSEFMGCSSSLSGAIRVNPRNIDDVTEAMNSAIKMSEEEQHFHHEKHYKYMNLHDVAYWARSFDQDLERAWGEYYPKRSWRFGFGLGFRVVALDPNFRKLTAESILSAYRRTQSHGSTCEVIITDDGATSINKMKALQATPKMLVELSKSQDAATGNGTPTVVVMTGALVEQCLLLLSQGSCPTVVLDSLHKASIKAVDVLSTTAAVSRTVLEDKDNL